MRTLKAIVTALALPGLLITAGAEAAATRSGQVKARLAVNSKPVCAPGMVLRQAPVRQGYAPLRCIQPDSANDAGMGTATAAGHVGGAGKAVLIVGALAAAGVGIGIAVKGNDDSPGG